MRFYSLLCGLAAASLLGACKKDVTDDFGGSGTLRGRLVATDRFAGPGTPLPVAGRQVRLGTDLTDRLNFKYSVVTDKDGYFLFEHLHTGQPYALFFADTVRRVRYAAAQQALPSDKPVLLQAQNDTLDQNGLFVRVLSGSASSSPPLAGVTLCVFSNQLQAQADTCLNRQFELKTDDAGRAVRYGLSPGRYYLVGTTTLAGQTYRVSDVVDVPATGIGRRTLAATPYTRQRTGFDLTVIDRRGTPLPGLQVCVFGSAVLARVDTCAGSIRQLTTDANGQVRTYGLAPRRYYLRLRAQYGNLRLRGYDSLDVQANQVPSHVSEAH